MITPRIHNPPARFDRAAPLPRRTLHDLMATGVGQASAPRLAGVTVLGGLGALVILEYRPDWWVLAMVMAAIACFGGYGLTKQLSYAMVLAREGSHRRRTLLKIGRWCCLFVGLMASLAAVAGALLMILQPRTHL